jgi:hypothetical protein
MGLSIPIRPLTQATSLTPAVKAALISAISVIILFIRKTDAFVNPQFWAEDGALVFVQQYAYGGSAMLEPYAGYLTFVPRLVAFFADLLFPNSLIPVVYNYATLALTLLVVSSIYSPRVALPNKALLSLTMVLVPHYKNEIFLSLTNLQWVLAILMVITLLKEKPHPRYGSVPLQVAFDATVILCCGLTGPFVIFLTPFFLWKFLNSEGKHGSIVLLTVAATALIQTCVLVSTMLLAPESRSIDTRPTIYSRVIGQRFFGNLFLGTWLPYEMNPWVLSILLVLFISFIVFLEIGQKEYKNLIVVLLCVSFVISLATMYKFKSNPKALIPPGNGSRYLYVPYVLMVWSLILCIKQNVQWKRVTVIILLGTILASSLTSGFHSTPFVDYEWKRHSERIGKEDNLMIPINPRGWYMRVPRKRHD